MTKEKRRKAKLTIFITVKVLFTCTCFFIAGLMLLLTACFISDKSTLSQANKIDLKGITQTVVKTSQISRSEKRTLPQKFESTMKRTITGKETVKGDKAIILEKKLRNQKEKKHKAKINSTYNLELMAHLIYGEAGDQGDECQQAVGMVVINRVNDNSFKAKTIKDVIFSPGQYACTKDGNFNRTPSKQAYKNAKAVLKGNTIISVPKDVVYQSQFAQGSGVWRKIGTETFCRK